MGVGVGMERGHCRLYLCFILALMLLELIMITTTMMTMNGFQAVAEKPFLHLKTAGLAFAALQDIITLHNKVVWYGSSSSLFSGAVFVFSLLFSFLSSPLLVNSVKAQIYKSSDIDASTSRQINSEQSVFYICDMSNSQRWRAHDGLHLPLALCLFLAALDPLFCCHPDLWDAIEVVRRGGRERGMLAQGWPAVDGGYWNPSLRLLGT